MKKITVLVSSVRKVRAADNILSFVKKNLETYDDIEFKVVDLKDLELPFFDSSKLPTDETFKIPYDNVRVWSDAVESADGVIMLTPEYNHSLSAAQKNAIDWLYSQWQDKPVAIVSYSWGATYAIDHLASVLAQVNALKVEPVARLAFKKDIEIDGSAIDQKAVDDKISATISALLA